MSFFAHIRWCHKWYGHLMFRVVDAGVRILRHPIIERSLEILRVKYELEEYTDEGCKASLQSSMFPRKLSHRTLYFLTLASLLWQLKSALSEFFLFKSDKKHIFPFPYLGCIEHTKQWHCVHCPLIKEPFTALITSLFLSLCEHYSPPVWMIQVDPLLSL